MGISGTVGYGLITRDPLVANPQNRAGLGSGVIKPAELALLTALGSGGQGGGWRFGGGGGVCWRGERRRLLRLRRAGVSADPLCPMSACLLPGRLPNSHATVIAYGATVPHFFPLHLALLLLALWWLAI